MTRPDLPPAAAVLQLVAGKWLSAAVSVAAKLGVADEVAAGPRSPAEIAAAVGAHPDALRRVLRALASVGVFVEDDQGRFGNTPHSDTLRTGPDTMRAMAIMMADRPIAHAWDELEHSVRTGESAFEKVHGGTLFEQIAKDAEFARTFSDAMTSRSAMEVKAVTGSCDFSGVPTIVDVAGGHGLLIAAVLAKTPSQRGVLFEMPQVAAGAGPLLERAGVASRCEIVAGDFFEHVPRADGYLMKHILHDWDDASCVRILRNVHAASDPGARLFVIESVIGPANAPHFGKLLDLQMLVVTPGGRERTRHEWEHLLAAGGFALERVVDTGAPVSVLVATRA